MITKYRKPLFSLILSAGIICLQGCIGATAMTSHEGIQLSSQYNEYVKEPEFENIGQGYSTANKNDPGYPMHYRNGDIEVEIQANCINNMIVSVIPSLIVPLPPIIPLFVGSNDVANENLALNQYGCLSNDTTIESIEYGGKTYKPEKVKYCRYDFSLKCSELTEGGVINLKSESREISIDIIYKKTYNLIWGWLGA